MIRNALLSDASQIVEIYNYYIKHTIVTFEISPINAKTMEERMSKVISKYPWLIYEENGHVLGYAYASEWKPRGAYKNTVESTVYLKEASEGRGIGSKLYSELIDRLRSTEIHTIIGGIGQPNEASVALHEKFGFKKVAHFNEIGNKFGKWIDVAYWQLIL